MTSTIQCPSCEKIYELNGCLKNEVLRNHFNRNNMCKIWNDLLTNKEDKLALIIQETEKLSKTLITNNTCDVCNNNYGSRNALFKHLRNHQECNKISKYNKLDHIFYSDIFDDSNDEIRFNNILKEVGPLDFYDKKVQYETAPPKNNSKLFHIIWNLYLTDKTSINDLDNEILQNNINYIICIVPDIITLKHSADYICYGNTHSPIITNEQIEKFEKTYDKIESLQKERKNTLIFCNSGYQRSLPFICNYLLTRHREEVKTLDSALDIVLSQLDKENYNVIKEPTSISLRQLIKEDGSEFLK